MIRSKFSITLPLLFLTLLVAGCNDDTPTEPIKSKSASEAGSAADDDDHDDDHSHEAGPNGGVLTDWGETEYHVEFAVDHEAQEATVYFLGSNAKLPVPVAAEKLHLSIADPAIEVDLMPSPLEGETDGKSSRFVGKHENLGVAQEYAGTIRGKADGVVVETEFAEEPAEEK